MDVPNMFPADSFLECVSSRPCLQTSNACLMKFSENVGVFVRSSSFADCSREWRTGIRKKCVSFPSNAIGTEPCLSQARIAFHTSGSDGSASQCKTALPRDSVKAIIGPRGPDSVPIAKRLLDALVNFSALKTTFCTKAGPAEFGKFKFFGKFSAGRSEPNLIFLNVFDLDDAPIICI